MSPSTAARLSSLPAGQYQCQYQCQLSRKRVVSLPSFQKRWRLRSSVVRWLFTSQLGSRCERKRLSVGEKNAVNWLRRILPFFHDFTTEQRRNNFQKR